MSRLSKMLLIIISSYFVSAYGILALEGGTVSLHGGLGFPENNTRFKYENTNFRGGLALGLKSGTIRYELELFYIMNSIKKESVAADKGNLQLFNGSVNMLYDIEGLSLPITPYIGGGFGYVFSRIEYTKTGEENKVKSTKNVPGYQFKCGLIYLTDEDFGIDFGYTYFRTFKLGLLGDEHYQQHQLNIGFIWYLG